MIKTTLETSEDDKNYTRNEWRDKNYTPNEWRDKNYTPNDCKFLEASPDFLSFATVLSIIFPKETKEFLKLIKCKECQKIKVEPPPVASEEVYEKLLQDYRWLHSFRV